MCAVDGVSGSSQCPCALLSTVVVKTIAAKKLRGRLIRLGGTLECGTSWQHLSWNIIDDACLFNLRECELCFSTRAVEASIARNTKCCMNVSDHLHLSSRVTTSFLFAPQTQRMPIFTRLFFHLACLVGPLAGQGFGCLLGYGYLLAWCWVYEDEDEDRGSSGNLWTKVASY